MRRAVAVLGLLCAVVLAGCSEDETEPTTSPTSSESTTEASPDESSDGPSEEPSDDTTSIKITFADGSVTPNGERVEVPAGEEFELVVSADEPGELHVHSTPEQELPYGTGNTTFPMTIDEPGIVEVEDHHLGLVVVQLEVR
jgi:hypothetical protein